jgi:hypothetical protein
MMLEAVRSKTMMTKVMTSHMLAHHTPLKGDDFY